MGGKILLHLSKVRKYAIVGFFSFLILIMMPNSIPPAYANNVDVKVTLERIRCLQNCSSSILASIITYTANVSIDGQSFFIQSPQVGSTDISPDWEFSKSVDISQGNVSINLAVGSQLQPDPRITSGTIIILPTVPRDINPNSARDLSIQGQVST